MRPWWELSGGSHVVGCSNRCMVGCDERCMVNHSGGTWWDLHSLVRILPALQRPLRMQDLVQARHSSPSVCPSIQSSPRPAGVPPGLPPAPPLALGMLFASSAAGAVFALLPFLQDNSSILPGQKCEHPPVPQPCPAFSLPPLLLPTPAPWLFSFPKSRSGMLWPVFMAIMNMIKINACIFNVSINKGKQSLLLT